MWINYSKRVIRKRFLQYVWLLYHFSNPYTFFCLNQHHTTSHFHQCLGYWRCKRVTTIVVCRKERSDFDEIECEMVWESCRFEREKEGKFDDNGCEDVGWGCLFGLIWLLIGRKWSDLEVMIQWSRHLI